MDAPLIDAMTDFTRCFLGQLNLFFGSQFLEIYAANLKLSIVFPHQFYLIKIVENQRHSSLLIGNYILEL